MPGGDGGSQEELEALRELIEDDPAALAAAGLPLPLPAVDVTAILVAHDGAPWLSETLSALRSQTRPPDRVIAVDTGSQDGGRDQLTAALGATAVLTADRRAGFGSAVALAVAELPAEPQDRTPGWVWLIHDDCAPAPDALETLLRAAADAPSVHMVGPKVLDWDDPRHLVEVGLTVDRSGRRATGLDAAELDQGQHDAPHDVLAVGTAGALVRLDRWRQLGGLDPRLPFFRDDLDLGWRITRAGGRVRVVPAATVRHARAASTGTRHADAAPGVARRIDRGHALFVLLANASPLALLGVLPRAVIAGILRALGFLVTRRPHQAVDELWALAAAVRPVRLYSARRWRRRQRSATADGRRAVRSLLQPRGTRVRAAIGRLGDWVTGAGVPPAVSAESGPVAEEAEELLPADDVGRLRRFLGRPVLVCTLVLTLVALVADRHLLTNGELFGGRLLPAPGRAVEMWRDYASTWHPAGPGGSSDPSAPWTPWLAIAATIVGGRVSVAVALLLLLAVPCAGLAMWASLRRLALPTTARLWAAATYALLPVATGSVGSGRFDAVVAVVAMPVLLRGVARLVSRSRRRSANRSAWRLGLGLACVAAFSPPVWVFAGAALVACAAFRLVTGAVRATVRLLIPVVVPVALALPWLPRLAADPGVLITGLGRPGGLAGQAGSARPTGSQLLAFTPYAHAGPLSPGLPVWLIAPVLAAAVAGLLAADRQVRRRSEASWAVALFGWAAAVLAVRTALPAQGEGQDGWAGPALALAAVGIVTSAAVAATALGDRLRSSSFGARQVGAALLVLCCLPLPAVLGIRWVTHGAQGQLARRTVAPLPADVLTDAASSGPGQRALFLSSTHTGQVEYALADLAGPTLGTEEQVTSPAVSRLLDSVVRDLGTARGTDAAEVLSTFDVHVVAVLGRGRTRLTEALDSQPALTRRATGSYNGSLWQLTVPATRLAVLGPALAAVAAHPAASDAGSGRGPQRAQLAATPPLTLFAGPEGALATLPPGPEGRLLVLAEASDAHWRAQLDGHDLPAATAWGWAQAFRLPSGGGALTVRRDSSERHLQLILQAVALLVVLVFAAPTLGRDRSDSDGVEVDGDQVDEVETPADPLHVLASLDRLRAGVT